MRLVSRALILAGLLLWPLFLAAQVNFVNGQAAVAVIGQKNFSANRPGAAAHELGTVSGLAVIGDRLIVTDGGLPFNTPSNHRILIFNNLSGLVLGASASVVIGQEGFGTNTPGLTEKTFSRPVGISTDGQRLAVADNGNNRVLIFNRIPTSNGASADVVVGQADFRTNPPGTTNNRMRGPNGVFLDGRRLFVADTQNHRVLMYNSTPGSNNANADLVLGQADFNNRAEQAASATSLRDPTSVFTDGVRLIVTDLGHNRVLIYNRIPTSNNAAADMVIGQPDFSKEAAGAGRAALNFPRYAFTDGTRLFIADTGNNRVLVFNQIPTTNGASADAVLGQKDFMTAADPEEDVERLDAGLMALPVAMASSNGAVLVADTSHRRVLKFVPGLELFSRGSVLSAASFGGNGVARPTNVRVEVQPEGQVPAGTYYIKVTAEGGILFESTPSEEVAVTVAENNSKLVVTFDESPGATVYRVYLGGSPGGQNRYFTTETPAQGPIVRSVAISNLATLNTIGPRLEVTPGSMAVLFGRDLASGIAVAGGIPLPRELAGVTLLVNGVAAPLFYVSPGQINFQVPWETDGTSASFVLQKRSASGVATLSSAVSVGISDLTPGVFTVSGDGVGRLLAFHPDFTPVTDERPLVPGETIILYGTGVQKVTKLGQLIASATLDTRARGEISVTPQGEVTWSTSFVPGARVYVSVDDGGENLLAEGASGTVTVDFILPGHVYRFILRLFVDGEVRETLATATLDTRSSAGAGSVRTSIARRNSVSLSSRQPAGEISVTPAGSVTWSTSELEDARVYVSVDNGWESLFAEGKSGTKAVEADFIQPGHTYRFLLRVVGESPGTRTGEAAPGEIQIDTTVSVAIQGRDAPIRFAGLAPNFVGLFQFNVIVAPDLEENGEDAEVRLFVGSIPANQTFLPVRDAATGEISATREGVVTWSTSLVAGARVYVSVNDNEETLLAEGLSGTVTVDFIQPGNVYRFILRKFANDTAGKALATATLDTR